MSAPRRLADTLMAGAGRLIPLRQREWAEAMAAEQSQIEDPAAALAFSAGCLRAAAWERLRALAPDGSWFWPGVAIGLLLLGTASIPGSRSWPLIWAPVGGLATVMTLAHAGARCNFARTVFLVFQTGLLGALLFFAGALFLFLSPGEAQSGRVAQFAFVAMLLAFVTTISGAAAAPLVCSPPGAGASSHRRRIDMRIARHPGWTAGLALGILYLFEAVFSTAILFAAWPILGGLFAAALVRWNPAARLTPGSGAQAGAKAGLVGGLVLLVVGTPLTFYLMQQLGEEPGFFGITFDLSPIVTLLVMFGIYALFGTLLAAAAGALTGLLGGRATAQRDEPLSR